MLVTRFRKDHTYTNDPRQEIKPNNKKEFKKRITKNYLLQIKNQNTKQYNK